MKTNSFFKVLSLVSMLTFSFSGYTNQKGGGGGRCKQEFSRVFEQLVGQIEYLKIALPHGLTISLLNEKFSEIYVIEKDQAFSCFGEEGVAACSDVSLNQITLRCDDSNSSWDKLSQIDKQQNVIHEVLYWISSLNDQNGQYSSRIVSRVNKRQEDYESGSQTIIYVAGLQTCPYPSSALKVAMKKLETEEGYYLAAKERKEDAERKFELAMERNRNGIGTYQAVERALLSAERYVKSFYEAKAKFRALKDETSYLIDLECTRVEPSSYRNRTCTLSMPPGETRGMSLYKEFSTTGISGRVVSRNSEVEILKETVRTTTSDGKPLKTTKVRILKNFVSGESYYAKDAFPGEVGYMSKYYMDKWCF